MKVTDFKLTFKDINSAIAAARMFELRKQVSLAVFDGKFKDARKFQKELAANAVNNFDIYKQLPLMHINMPRMSFKSMLELVLNTFKFKIYNKFTRKTPEEKQLNQLAKDYYSNLTKDDLKKNTIDITIPSLY